ncbi:hypothetical protein [Streptomyces sp. JJ38]|uniref:hypothetical protein n=1 Tax=Streptomyces sp. JJ38 TaxID=2738128 RepID=UPI001C586736|nr:hypothetical protein [Streptomyces sp. JJ38]MBW1598256.1 hypothetical protein [Streptomyces sp. JJ38]
MDAFRARQLARLLTLSGMAATAVPVDAEDPAGEWLVHDDEGRDITRTARQALRVGDPRHPVQGRGFLVPGSGQSTVG